MRDLVGELLPIHQYQPCPHHVDVVNLPAGRRASDPVAYLQIVADAFHSSVLTVASSPLLLMTAGSKLKLSFWSWICVSCRA